MRQSYIHIYKKVDTFTTSVLFISDENEEAFVEKREEALQDGYELVYDSATSVEQAVLKCREEKMGTASDYDITSLKLSLGGVFNE